MKKVLIIDDDLFFFRMIKSAFEGSGVLVDPAFDIGTGIYKVSEQLYDLVLLDLKLPSTNGLEHISIVKSLSDASVVICTADNKPQIESECLSFGVKDFIMKNRGVNVLLSRINMHLNLARNESEINLDAGCLDMYNDKIIKFTSTQKKMFLYLFSHRNNNVTKQELSYLCNGMEHDGLSRSVDIHIFRLRKALTLHKFLDLTIETNRGKGYILKCAVC